MDRNIVALAFAACSLAAVPAAAQEFSQGVRSAGMGEAFTAVASGTSALYHNPAGAARAPMYALDAGYEYTPTGNALSAAIVDSKTNPSIAAGVGYGYYFGRGDDKVRGHDIRVGLALPVMPDRISVGIGGHWLIVKDTITTMDDAGDPVQTDIELMNGPTIDAGIMFRATRLLHFGVAGRNLIEQCKRAGCEAIAPTIISGGLAFGLESGLLLSGDVGVDLTTAPDPAPDLGAGIEYLISGVVPIRAGYQYKGGLTQHLLTFGAGWRSTAAGVDVGYQLDLQDTSNMFFMGSFSIYL